MHSSQPPLGGSPPAALPALLRATHLLGLALGSAFGRLRESGATAARLFERAEESALLLRMIREAAAILGARWDKVPERHRPHYVPEERFRILRIQSFLCLSQRGRWRRRAPTETPHVPWLHRILLFAASPTWSRLWSRRWNWPGSVGTI